MSDGDDPATTRGAILQAFREHKGLHKSELCRCTGRGWGTIGHHVYVLVQRDQVLTEVHGRQLWVFLPNIPKLERDWIVATHVPERRKLLNRLLGRKGVTIESLSSEMELSKKTIRTHLSHLKRIGAVKRTQESPAMYEAKTKQER